MSARSGARTTPAPAAPDPLFWHGRRVLLTGHTGFKGSWLSLWLSWLGADVTGFSAAPPSSPSLYEVARVGEGMKEMGGDVRDPLAVAAAVRESAPEVLLHLAAQPLVRLSYERPRETFETNVMGTVNVLEAVREVGEVRVLVNVTSDKCYANRVEAAPAPADDGGHAERAVGAIEAGGERGDSRAMYGTDVESWRGYDEQAPMGGDDPYSSSKGAAELVIDAYRRSFFSAPQATRVASARAGNVIGGGDWGAERLVPDFMRAALDGGRVLVRNPHAVRPWQHVLNPLSGYLVLAEALWEAPELAGGFNFGPADGDARTVGWLAGRLAELWPGGIEWAQGSPAPGHGSGDPPEARLLKLDSSKARERLGWAPALDLDDALALTVDWFRAYDRGEDMRHLTLGQIESVGCA
ncbi:MAG: GDP-mannose 4,6-dehydratase [Solirubrobacteraceae bacterium]